MDLFLLGIIPNANCFFKIIIRAIKWNKDGIEVLNCKTCGEGMIPKTIVWKEPDKPAVQHTNYVCDKCGTSEYKRYVL